MKRTLWTSVYYAYNSRIKWVRIEKYNSSYIEMKTYLYFKGYFVMMKNGNLVIFLVTKVSPLLGLSWLKRMPLQAYIP